MASISTPQLVQAVSQLCAEDFALEQTFEGFCGLLAQGVPLAVGILMVRAQEGLRVEFYYRQDALMKPDNALLPPGSISAGVLTSRAPRLFTNDEEWRGRTIFTFAGEGVPTRSAIFVPLLSSAEAVGVLSVQSFVPDAYREQDVAVVAACAAPLAQRVAGEYNNSVE